MIKYKNCCEKGRLGRFVAKYEERDLIGKTFNRLTVIKEVYRNKFKQRQVLCKCQCGKEKIIPISELTRGIIKSCGCLKVDRLTTHGMTKDNKRLMSIWVKMRLRCRDPKNKDYNGYGGRGIKVCDEWVNDLSAFINWAKKQDHWDDKNYSLDRIDVNGDYSPNNCRWVTNHIQSANRRKKISNTSGYTGVNYRKSDGYWVSRITINGKIIYTKCSKSKKECLDARNNYIVKNNLTEYPIQKWRDDD